ncbi:MAG: hypothetical protein AAB555_00655 [Patescibacteria group bacterium]
MTNKNEIPDIDKKLVGMDDEEVAEEDSADIQPSGNEAAAADIEKEMGGRMKEVARKDDKRFLVKEKTPRVH